MIDQVMKLTQSFLLNSEPEPQIIEKEVEKLVEVCYVLSKLVIMIIVATR